MSNRSFSVAALLLFPALSFAQEVVHFPDSAHAAPPANIAFPFYTPGGGAAGLDVRAQFLCPDAFLSTQPITAGYVTHVGFSIGGEAAYGQFVLRAGVAGSASLGADWAQNLPDQRVQLDLSGQVVQGGGSASAPSNEWRDFELAFPFHYAPGDELVVDLTTSIAVIDEYLTTSPSGGGVPRVYNYAYAPGAPANQADNSGLKIRFTFVPLEVIPFGAGCQASNGLVPALHSVGAPQLGQSLVLYADQALAGGLGVFVYGFSRQDVQGAPLPIDLGGGCALLTSADALVPSLIGASGVAGTDLTFPNDPSLEGAVLFCQFAQFDELSPANVPFSLSAGGMLSVY